MPALIGGFLRRGQVVSDININTIIILCMIQISLVGGFLHLSLNTEGLSNEIIFEGCVKWGKVQRISEELSTLGLTLVVLISLTKVNLHFKIGTAILRSSDYLIRSKSSYITSGIDESVYHESASKNYTNTEEDLLITQENDKYQDPKAYILKHGNLIKDIQLTLNADTFRLLTNKVTAIYLHLCLYINIVIKNLLYSSEKKQEYKRMHGGKIREEANVLGNARNTISYNNRGINVTRWPRVVHIGEKLNSQCLRMNYLGSIRNYSSIRDESHLEIDEIKRFMKNDLTQYWPDNKQLSLLHREAHREQMELVNLANIYGVYSNEVYNKQYIDSKSMLFRIVAIDKLSKSFGSKTPGIDNVSLTNKKEDKLIYLELFKWLKEVTKKPNSYEASSIKRIWIPKSNGKLRPLGIPTIKDRALQHLVNLVLEPLVELTGEPHSFGFRPYRSSKNAIAYLKSQLKTIDIDIALKYTSESVKRNDLSRQLPEEKWILDADIKGFFDNINHNWLIKNLFIHPSLNKFIVSWLKSGAIDKGIFYKTDTGTPQGGIISPTLANFTLNGLENVIMDSLKSFTKSKEKRIAIQLKDGHRTRIASGLAYVRYADDFIVLIRSKYIMTEYIIPAIKTFLAERGLTLSEEKTKVFRLKDENKQLDFLGYTIKYQEKWSIKRHIFYNQHAENRGIAIYPNKDKVIKFIDKVKFIFKRSQNLNAFNLIAKLNPIIRGWSNYYNLGNSSHYRSLVRNALYNLVWKWAHKKHRRWGRTAIANRYFLTIKDNSEIKKNPDYVKIKNTKWVFHDTINYKSRYNKDVNKSIYLVNPSMSTQLLSTKWYNIPNNLLNIHAYHKDYMKIVEFITNLNFRAQGINGPLKDKLLRKQNNICTYCGESLLTSIGIYENLHIHHINPIMKGGSRNKIDNMQLIHSWCHKDIHRRNESVTNEK